MEVFTAHNDSVLTDIADFLVQKDHISFRSAHNIISNISKSRNGIVDAPISLRILNNASIKISGKKTSLTHEELMKLQSPIVSIQRKQSSGSPSSQACQTMLQSAQIALQKDTDQLNTCLLYTSTPVCNDVKQSFNAIGVAIYPSIVVTSSGPFIVWQRTLIP